MKLSIACGTYKRLKTLKRMVNSVRKTVPDNWQLEFVIADNASNDGTWEWLVSQPDVIPLQMGAPIGAVKAFTKAAKAATGDYVILATDDTYFPARSIIRAVTHLETNERCGVVAFKHNKYTEHHEAHYVKGVWANGFSKRIVYPQICIVRKWLGDVVGWWGGDDPVMGQAFTYGGDNFLGAKVWGLGYTVDTVDLAHNCEDVIQDEPRRLNTDGAKRDAKLYFSLYPDGVPVSDTPQLPNPQQERLRILLAIHYNPKEPHHKAQKRWWREAFGEVGVVYDYDYAGRFAKGANTAVELANVCADFKPHLIITQVHAPRPDFGIDAVRNMRMIAPSAVMVNWNGDVYLKNVTRADTQAMLRHYDVALFSNRQLAAYCCKMGINAGYYPCTFEPVGELPTVDKHDVVFIGNTYSAFRKQLVDVLAALPYKTGLFGKGHPAQRSSTQYDVATNRALYRHAGVVISDQQFPDARAYVSNRFWEILAADGGICLQQYSKELDEATGLQAGVHYDVWRDFDELKVKIAYYLDNPDKARSIARSGYEFVSANHAPANRVNNLIFDILEGLH